jgi:hypothetical protein
MQRRCKNGHGKQVVRDHNGVRVRHEMLLKEAYLRDFSHVLDETIARNA